MSKIPRQLLAGGYSVAVCGQLGADAVAHRPDSVKRKNTGRVKGSNQPAEISVPVAACDLKGRQAALFSAAWADHKGAVACTESACFPDA
jgi:hypothetical protein